MDDESHNDLKSRLKTALINENLANFSMHVAGSAGKGDGYMGDIIFVRVDGVMNDGSSKIFNLVLKCSKDNISLRKVAPIQAVFENEIYFYSTILPAFTAFERASGVQVVFDSIPKYYGHCVTENNELIALEDLKTAGYTLHDKRQTLNRPHLQLVLHEYAKLHAISGTYGANNPQHFRTLTSGIINMMAKFCEYVDALSFFTPPVEEAYNLLKEELPDQICDKLLKLKNRISQVMFDIFSDTLSFRVVSHGDNWNNNFMFKYELSGSLPTEVKLIDWQMCSYISPIRDLSYFIYSCASKEDLSDIDAILELYHQHFSSHVCKLGGNPEKIYPLAQLLEDWKKWACHGLVYAIISAKITVTENEEIRSLADEADQESDISQAFNYDVKNQSLLKEKLKYIIEHAAETGII